MMVALAIMGVLTSIALTGGSAFNRSLLLANATYDVALSIRQAQVYGISSRTFGGITNAGYGVDFESANPNAYYFFADLYPSASGGTLEDKPGNGRYEAARGELVATYALNGQFSVIRFCGTLSSGTQNCSDSGSNALASLAIVFLRPNTEAIITGIHAGGTGVSYVSARITVGTSSGETRCININQTGQVAVAVSCS